MTIKIKDGKFYSETINGIKAVNIEVGTTIYISNNYINGVAIVLGGYNFDLEKNKFVPCKNGDWVCNEIFWMPNPNKKWYEFWKPKQICSRVAFERIR